MKTASPFMRKALAVATATVLSSVCLAQSQKSRMVTERMLGDATNSVIQSTKAYVDSKEFSREVYKYAEYFVTTNPVIDVTDATITNSFEEAFQGMAFDLYFTNSVYFIDENTVPTLKFFAPKRRRAYFGNRFSCVEIGDFWQVFKTYNQQVDGTLAVEDPSRIRFMSTLDRNAPYDTGTSMSLQDYLDAFNPVFVPETIRLFQTNRSDYSIGRIYVHDEWAAKDANDHTYFSVTPSLANFMDVLRIEPQFESGAYKMTNEVGQVTNWVQFVETNANARLDGTLNVIGDIGADNTLVRKTLSVYGFDDIVSRVWGWGIDANGNRFVQKGTEDVPGGGLRMTLKDYMDFMIEPFIAATNEYHVGEKVVQVHQMKKADGNVRAGEKVYLNGIGNVRPTLYLTTYNKRSYHYDAAVIDTTSFWHSGAVYNITNVVLVLPYPASYTNGTFKVTEHLNTTLTFDLSSCSHSVCLDIGTYNFAGINNGEEGGVWDTVLSSIEPDIRTEQVLRTEEYTSYDWVYDENLGDWLEDTEHPIVETYSWYDEYQTDMTFMIEPYTCKQFKFTQVGNRTMKVEIQQLYKTSPSTIQ